MRHRFGESLGTWNYVAEGRGLPGSLWLVYPNWGRPGVNNEFLAHIGKLTPESMTLSALADVPIEFEKRGNHEPKKPDIQRLERIHAELKGMPPGDMAALITRAAGGKAPTPEEMDTLIITLPSEASLGPRTEYWKFGILEGWERPVPRCSSLHGSNTPTFRRPFQNLTHFGRLSVFKDSSGTRTTEGEMHRAAALGLEKNGPDQQGPEAALSGAAAGPTCDEASGTDREQEHKRKQRVFVTLKDLSGPREQNTQHPLVCGPARDFPEGIEFLFTQTATGEMAHVVFPDGEEAPESAHGLFSVRGYYQGIQNWKAYKHKKPGSDHRYFVVTSWERHVE